MSHSFIKTLALTGTILLSLNFLSHAEATTMPKYKRDAATYAKALAWCQKKYSGSRDMQVQWTNNWGKVGYYCYYRR